MNVKSDWAAARSLTTTEARTYSEWVLLVGDLKYALKRAEIWENIAGAKSGNGCDAEVCVSLFRDAVISFVSCFDKQLPVHLDALNVYSQVPGGLDYFNWLTNLRNTWIAHRFGPYRQCEVAIFIDINTGNIQGIGNFSQLYYGPKAEAGGDLIRMIKIALEHAGNHEKNHEDTIKVYVEGLKKSERLKLSVARTIVPASDEVNLGRKKFRNIKRQSRRSRRS